MLERPDVILLDSLSLVTERMSDIGPVDCYFRGLSGSSATRRLWQLLSRSSCAVWLERRALSVWATTFTGELCQCVYVLGN